MCNDDTCECKIEFKKDSYADGIYNLHKITKYLKDNLEPYEIISLVENIMKDCVSDFMTDAAKTDDSDEKSLLVSFAVKFTDARNHLRKAASLTNPGKE